MVLCSNCMTSFIWSIYLSVSGGALVLRFTLSQSVADGRWGQLSRAKSAKSWSSMLLCVWVCVLSRTKLIKHKECTVILSLQSASVFVLENVLIGWLYLRIRYITSSHLRTDVRRPCSYKSPCFRLCFYMRWNTVYNVNNYLLFCPSCCFQSQTRYHLWSPMITWRR